jgi:hypothetical protein
VLTKQQYVSELANKHSIRVDPATLQPVVSGAFFGGYSAFEDEKRRIQSTIAMIEKDRGFKCNRCGGTYCVDCLMNFAPLHPTSGGKACFSCGGAFSEL